MVVDTLENESADVVPVAKDDGEGLVDMPGPVWPAGNEPARDPESIRDAA